MFRMLSFALLAAVAALLVLCFVPRDSVLGIEVGGDLYSIQSPLENFQYRRLMKAVVAGDQNALGKLVDMPCGGGAGCYDHGAVLAHILIKVGDFKFSLMAGALDKHAKRQLGGLLAAGFEYGFPTPVNADDSKLMYPLTAEALSPMPARPQSTFDSGQT